MNYEKYLKLMKVASGKQPVDLVLKNATVVNVFSGQLIQGDVGICDDVIVGVGEYEGVTQCDCTGKFIVPGFIDAHLHFESTLVAPPELIANAVAFGTTTYIADPHEAANVSGPMGIDYILEQTEQVPANVYVMVPSCVPSASFEENGFTLTAEHMLAYRDHPRILGLGEVMDYRSVINGDYEMAQKLSLFAHKKRDGHAPFLKDHELDAYVLAGIDTDHECCDFAYALKQVERGMQVHIRQGSAAKNLDAIVKGIVEHQIDTRSFCFCTDDKHIEEIRREGHISYCIARAIQLGIPAVAAIQMATLQAARCYGLSHLGAIAPGYQADIVILDSLEEVEIHSVYHKGRLVSENKAPAICEVPSCKKELRKTVKVSLPTKEDLALRVSSEECPVIGLVDGQIITQKCIESVPTENGFFKPTSQYNKIAVLERHKATGHLGVGIVKNFGIRQGAIASSVSHDCHNIAVVGDNDEDMLLAIEELTRTQGGYAIVHNGKVIASLPLPIMGLMSDQGHESVNQTLHEIITLAYEMGVNPSIDPFITLSFIALPVIPELRLTTRGLYDVTEERMISDVATAHQ